LVAGTCFIIPAMGIVMALAWAYTTYGTVPEAVSLLYGIKPVIIAVVAQALWALGRTAIRGWRSAAVGVAVLGLFLAGVNELVLLAAGGLAVMLMVNMRHLRGAAAGFAPTALWASAAVIVAPVAMVAGVTWQLGRVAVPDVTTAALAFGAVVLPIRTRVQSAWVVAAGATIGLARLWLR